MTPHQLIAWLLQKSNMTQQELAAKMGYSSQGTVSNRLSRQNMYVGSFLETVDAFDYELVARPKGSPVNDQEIVVNIARPAVTATNKRSCTTRNKEGET